MFSGILMGESEIKASEKGNKINQKVYAINGSLDLTDYNFNKKGSLIVKGEWLFLWEKLLNPKNINFNKVKKNGQIIKFPGFWNKLRRKKSNLDQGGQKKYGPMGFGSFLLKVKGVKNVYKLGLSIKSFSSSYKLYIIQKDSVQKWGGNGTVGTFPGQTIPQLGPRFNDFIVNDGEFYILIHGSNFHYRGGGLLSGMKMGLKDEVKTAFDNTKVQKVFTLGIFLFE